MRSCSNAAWSMLVGAALLLAACGSTAKVGEGREGAPHREARAIQEGLELGPSEALELGVSQRGGATLEERGRSQPADSRPSVPAGAADRRENAPTAPSPTPPSRGIDDEHIAVGLAIYEGEEAFTEGLGVEGSSLGDQKANYKILLEHFNTRGGVAGREIVHVYHAYQATSSETFATQEQAACVTFTQDRPVFLSLAGGILDSDGPFNACMHNARTPVLSSSHYSGFEDATFARYPTFAETNTLTFDAVLRLWPAALAQHGYFEPLSPSTPTRVGLVTYDWEPMRRMIENSLEPAMNATGNEIHEKAYIRRPDRLSDAGQMSADATNAVLRFRAAGIQHVMVFPNRLLSLVFMNAAESQAYRPRYGLTTPNGQLQVGSVPRDQFRDAHLLGWSPLLDVADSEFDEPMGEAWNRCERIYAEAGMSFPDANARLIGHIACEQLMSLLAAAGASPDPPAQETFIASFLELGTSYQSPVVGPTRFARDRHYGVSRTRVAQFADDCTCFRYTGPWRIDT